MHKNGGVPTTTKYCIRIKTQINIFKYGHKRACFSRGALNKTHSHTEYTNAIISIRVPIKTTIIISVN